MKDRAQAKNPMSNRYVKLDLEKGMVIGHKKSKGPYKNIKILRKEGDINANR